MMKLRTNSCFMVYCLIAVYIKVVGGDSNATMSTVLNTIFDGYDKKLPPNYEKDGSEKQVQVTVNMFVNSLYSISEMDMDFSMSIFLRERWMDDRLQYDNSLNVTRLVVDNALFGNIWMPDIYILNEKSSDYHEVMVTNKLIHIYPNGTVQHSARVTGIFSCLIRLQKFPFDTQYCNFEVESFGHSTEDLKLVWSDEAVSVAENIEIPQFTIQNIKSFSCEKNYYGIVYPCIGVTFVLERNYAYYIIQIYIPSILIIVLSWVSFWLDPAAVPARISLGLLTVLTMTTQSSGARANLPRVSYVKAIDVYMATCISFVFLAMVEFAFVNVLARRQTEQSPDLKEDKETKGNNSVRRIQIKPQMQPEDDEDDQSVSDTTGKKQGGLNGFIVFVKTLSPKTVDRISRILFPVVFAIFNLVYWIHYFYFAKREET